MLLQNLSSHIMGTHYETATYRSFYTVSIAVAIVRGTAETILGLANRMKKRGWEGVLAQDYSNAVVCFYSLSSSTVRLELMEL